MSICEKHTIASVITKVIENINQEHNETVQTINGGTDNNQLNQFLEKYIHLYVDNNFISKFIESKCSHNCEEINKWAEENGFPIKLTDRGSDPLQYYVASILKMLFQFSGGIQQKSILTSQEKQYNSFKMNTHSDFTAYKNPNNEILLTLKTKNPDVNIHIVPMSIGENDSIENHDDYIRSVWSKKFERVVPSYIEVPNVNYDVKPDISWIKDLHLQGKEITFDIVEALQQIIFKMDYKGIDLKSCSIMGFSGYSGCAAEFQYCEPIIIDKPFLLWISHTKCTNPIFIAHLDQQYWEETKD